MIAVLVPVLARPARVRPLVDSLERASRFVECRPVFIASPDDEAELKALNKERVDYITLDAPAERGDYARKINAGFAACDEEFVFLAADDLTFHPGWAERALAAHMETGACVVGTNDLGNSRVTAGRHSTHTLVHRDYGECGTVEQTGVLLHEGYWHNYVDDEFVETAKARGTFHHATDSLVEHLHPNWGKAPDDPTYRRGQERFPEDRQLFVSRRPLWSRL